MDAPGIPPLTPHSRIVAGRGQLSAKLAGEAVILGLSDSVYYGLDGSGARIWELVQQPVSLASIVDTLSAEYDVERDVAMRDLIDLAHTLRAKGLLDVVPDAAP
jgi:coenzyme PQQ synthesis protein D (PqqD)